MSGWQASAPLRADLAGGTLDLWPLYLLHPGACTVNVALTLRARAEFVPGPGRWVLRAGDHGAVRRVSPQRVPALARKPVPGDPFALVYRAIETCDPGCTGELRTFVQGPAGGGLGGSSALVVALLGLLGAVAGAPVRRNRLADVARDLEASVLGYPTGTQDHHPAIRGGPLVLHYGLGETRVQRLPAATLAVAERLVLAYSGRPHASAPTNWALYRRRIEGDPVAVEAFERIRGAAQRAARALERRDWRALAAAMNADWRARQDMDPALAPSDLRRLESAAREAGVAAAKCCGAASGGCMLLLLRRTGDRTRVEGALREAGAEVLPFGLSRGGLRVRRLRS